MKQPHTEQNIIHSDGDQNTGNHKKPDAVDATGVDRTGGTRAGSGNVESAGETGSTQSGPDVERLRPLERGPTKDVTGSAHAERAPERDEHGRL